jgi:nicotinate-nucleotide adenylyltransferase
VKLGIFGGSFNPVHLGHLFIADKALVKLNLDRIVLVPAFISPFKPEVKNMEISANNRIEMLCAAVAGDNRLAIDDCEIRRQGVSYTVDTLEDIITRYIPDGKPYLIIGDDLAKDFLKWKDSKKILELADIVIACRLKNAADKYPFPHTLIDNEIIDISSQTIRKKISENSDWRSLVPSAVRVIIEDRHLYDLPAKNVKKPDEDSRQSNIIRIESVVRETLNLTRFLHSRNTALLAADLCGRFGLDPDAGYLAGIAHDFCKQLEIKQMIKLAKSDGKRISALEKGKPGLLHGRAAAVLLRERFSIHNKDILEAVAVHTSGSEDMGPLAKVIYIADKVEVSRNIDASLRKMCYENDLDDILLAVLKKTITKLQSKDMALSLETVKLLEKMKGRNN